MIKRGDKHDVKLTIVGPPMNLNGGTAKVFVTPSAGGSVTPFNATILDNVVTWSLDGTLPVGKYNLEVQVTIGGNIVTAPNGGYMELRVVQDLGS